MKQLNTIFEKHYSRGNQLDPEVSGYYWKMKKLVGNNWAQFRKIYDTELRSILINFLKECGEGEWYTVFIKPVKIEFDYNIKNDYTAGLICGFYLSKEEEPILFVDCLDNKPLFGLGIDSLVNNTKMLRLRNNVLIDAESLYNLITKGDIAYTISREDCKKYRSSYVEKMTSQSGQMAEALKKQLKFKKYADFENTLKSIITSHGEKYSNGQTIRLKRSGRFWNCFISEVSLVKNDIWLSVYWQGDSTDGDQDIKLADVFKNGKYVITHRDERFTVDFDNLYDMIEDIEVFLKEQ